MISTQPYIIQKILFLELEQFKKYKFTKKETKYKAKIFNNDIMLKFHRGG